MRTTLRWLIAIALLCAVASAGCGGDDDEAQSESTADGGGGGGDDDDDDGDDDDGDDGGGGGVPGSPIDIPSFQADQGRPLADVLADIERTVREQCGGELCIEIQVEMSDDGFQECQFVETVPPQGSQVERGGTLVVIAGTQPCEGEPPDDNDDGDSDDDSDDSDDDSDTDDNGDTDDTEGTP